MILSPFQGASGYERLSKLYIIEWAQHPFQYYDIQSSEIVQMSRVPQDLLAFQEALRYDGSPSKINRLFRLWELTNTRYLIGVAGLLDSINQKYGSGSTPIPHPVTIFNISAHGEPSSEGQIDNLYRGTGILDGEYALFEFSGALPRANLFSNWQVNADDQATLNEPGQPVL